MRGKPVAALPSPLAPWQPLHAATPFAPCAASVAPAWRCASVGSVTATGAITGPLATGAGAGADPEADADAAAVVLDAAGAGAAACCSRWHAARPHARAAATRRWNAAFMR